MAKPVPFIHPRQQLTKKCLRPNCKTPAYTRGLCFADYTTALRLVKAHRTTWEKLEQEGKSKSARRGRTQTWVQSWLLGEDS